MSIVYFLRTGSTSSHNSPLFIHRANQQQQKALFFRFFHGNCYIPAALHIDCALIFIIRRGLTVFPRAAHFVTDKCGRI